MTEKVDFRDYLVEDENKTVDISEVKDVSQASNQYLQIESEILALENQAKVKKQEHEISNTYIDDILVRLSDAEENIDVALKAIDDLDLRVGKVESRLGLG